MSRKNMRFFLTAQINLDLDLDLGLDLNYFKRLLK